MGVESRGASFHTLDLLFIYYLSIDDLLFTTAQNHVILRIFAVNMFYSPQIEFEAQYDSFIVLDLIP